MRHRSKPLRNIALAVAVIVIGGAAAANIAAAAVFTLEFNNHVFLTQTSVSSSNPLTQTFSTSSNHSTATGTGFAGNGTLTNRLESFRDDSGFGANGSTSIVTISTYDDIVFFNIANPTSMAFVSVAARADFTASQEPEAIYNAIFNVAIGFPGAVSDIGLTSLLGDPITGTVTSPTISVQLNTFVTLGISASLRNSLISAFGFPKGTTISNSTVTFDTFILPQGIGVTSASLFPPSSVIPLPAALPLFLTGLAGLGLMMRRQRQRQA